MQPDPLTSCLLLDSGLGGQASLAAASWVRKEEKSHILWWLYPLGSLPETLATEQTVGCQGVEGESWGLPTQPRQGRGSENRRAQQRGPPWPLEVNSDPRAGGRGPEGRAWEPVPLLVPGCPETLTSSFLLCFLRSLG